MANWLVLNNDTSKILEITYAQLIVANIRYELFGKLIKGLSHLEDFKTLVVKGPSFTKIIETSTSSSFANGFSGRFFGFVKYSGFLGSVKRPFLLIKIEEPPQILANEVISLFLSYVGSTSNDNDEQLQFKYIFQFDFGVGQLLILCDTIKGLILISEVGSAGNSNGELF